jgi:hypothetical protein
MVNHQVTGTRDLFSWITTHSCRLAHGSQFSNGGHASEICMITRAGRNGSEVFDLDLVSPAS